LRPPIIAVTVPRRQSAAFGEYLQRIEQAGGVARELTPESAAAGVIDAVDGMLLPGGGDVDPARYGAIAQAETDGVRPELDAFEVELLNLGRQRSLPVLAICRGHQLVNVAFGGALHQHIAGDGHRAVPGDTPQWHWKSRWHAVRLEPDSRLASLLGSTEVQVNSRHHQAVRPELLAPGLRAAGLSPDGYVEASEAEDGSWLLSVQWHPEREEVIAGFRPLFEALIGAATERMAINTTSNAGNPVLR